MVLTYMVLCSADTVKYDRVILLGVCYDATITACYITQVVNI